MKIWRWQVYIFSCFLLSSHASDATSKYSNDPRSLILPVFFSDNMVLQRDRPVRVWGESRLHHFEVRFAGHLRRVEPGIDGKWAVTFPSLPAGGPYSMVFKGDTNFTIKNILLGDIWLCSGQSNMEFILGGSNHIMEDLHAPPCHWIRQFKGGHISASRPGSFPLKGQWTEPVFDDMVQFSAVAYYFARKIFRETGIPIGLINTSWGGTTIKAWTSTAGMNHIPEFAEKLRDFLLEQGTALSIDSIQANYIADTMTIHRYYGLHDSGWLGRWFEPGIDTRNWRPVVLPGSLEQASRGRAFGGAIWFRRLFHIDGSPESHIYQVRLGVIDGTDEIWINGIKVANDCWKGSPRIFYVPGKILRSGMNVIALRVADLDSGAAVHPSEKGMALQAIDDSKGKPLSLSGEWIAAVGLTKEMFPKIPTWPEPLLNHKISSIFNGMNGPFLNYPIKGVLWYQGENDVDNAQFYRKLFINLIDDWRRQFHDPALPFIFAQLSSFGRSTPEPAESSWAEMRASQEAALTLNRTAMVVTMDVGDSLDVHPTEKRSVGERMAMQALKMVYARKSVPACPILQSAHIHQGKYILIFRSGAGHLCIHGPDPLQGFALAGSDGKYHWAQALLRGGNIVEVSCPEVPKPISVRYAWMGSLLQNNLCNQAGLPAAPFRTDHLPGITSGKIVFE